MLSREGRRRSVLGRVSAPFDMSTLAAPFVSNGPLVHGTRGLGSRGASDPTSAIVLARSRLPSPPRECSPSFLSSSGRLASGPVVTGRQLEVLVGHYVASAIFQRAGLAVMEVSFMIATSLPRVCWPLAGLMSALLVTLCSELDRPWAELVVCTDASLSGMGVCEAKRNAMLVRRVRERSEKCRVRSTRSVRVPPPPVGGPLEASRRSPPPRLPRMPIFALGTDGPSAKDFQKFRATSTAT